MKELIVEFIYEELIYDAFGDSDLIVTGMFTLDGETKEYTGSMEGEVYEMFLRDNFDLTVLHRGKE